MAGDKDHLDVTVALEPITQDHGLDAPDVALERPVPARGRSRRPRSVVDRACCRLPRPQRHEVPLGIAERLQAA
jgi:hypothetical protein